MSAEQQDPRCAHCGRALTADEREFYGTACEACEVELHHAMQDDRAPVLPPPPSEVERLRAENARLRVAFHDAIRRPLGVHGVFCNGVMTFDGKDYVKHARGPGQVLDRFNPSQGRHTLALAAQ